MLTIGCHLSPSQGLTAMGETALSLGGNTLQFFTRNPRGGRAKDIDPADAAGLCALQQSGKLGVIVAHAAYTINPCAAKPETLQFAVQTMEDDIRRMEYLPGNLYNFHPGSHVGQGEDAGIAKVAETLNTVMFPTQKTTVLLETMAGKGTELGGTFSQLRRILDRVKYPEKMGVCLDTCHVFDGGYDIVGQLDAVLEKFDKIVGLPLLRAVHLNDSMNGLGSHKDRHAKIGEGNIGLAALVNIVNHPALRHLPFILETPNELPGYAAEIALMQKNFRELS